MDYQPQPQFEESALKESCSADCSSCPTFPAPFRRIGDSTYCRFSQLTFAAGEGVTFPADRMVRILFVMSGSLRLEHGNDTVRLVTSKQCVCLARSERFVVTAQDDETHVVVLSLIHRIEFCEQDIFDKVMPYDSVVPTESVPMLSMHPAIERLLSTFFTIRQMFNCVRYHRMKATELFMMIKVLYTPTEHAYFFQSMIQPQDNFRVFVCNNYDKAQGVAELASLAGMSLSVFKRRFAEHFNDSVYHWMMRQKALKVFTDIRDGEDSTKALMNTNRDYIDYFSTDAETFLYDLTEILTDDELAKIGEENIIYYTTADKTRIPIAVDLTNTKVKTDTDLTLESPCYGVVVSAKNPENAIAFIRYAFDL